MSGVSGPVVRRTPEGDFEVRMPANERAVLRALPSHLRETLRGDDPAFRRLFPPAYADDPDREAEFRDLVGSDLVAARLRNAEAMERTAEATRLTEDELVAWLGVLNDLRLVLGSRLDITEETAAREPAPGDPDAPAYATFHYLGWLVAQIVDTLDRPA